MMAFFAIVFVIGLVLFVVGMIKPTAVVKWGPLEKRTRKTAAITYLSMVVVSFVLFGITDDGSAKSKREQVAIEEQQKKADEAAAEAIKKQNEEQKKQADIAAKEVERQEKLQHTIKISKLYTSDPNSAGGVDLHIVWTNMSDKEIKYISFEVIPYNAVNDAVKCGIRGYSDFTGKSTGPFAPGNTYGADKLWSCAWYNNTITRAELNGVKIEYMDGTTTKLDKNDIATIKI